MVTCHHCQSTHVLACVLYLLYTCSKHVSSVLFTCTHSLALQFSVTHTSEGSVVDNDSKGGRLLLWVAQFVCCGHFPPHCYLVSVDYVYVTFLGFAARIGVVVQEPVRFEHETSASSMICRTCLRMQRENKFIGDVRALRKEIAYHTW